MHICNRGDITSSTAPVFGLGHNMGRFATFVPGSTQLLHHILGSKQISQNKKLSCHVLDFFRVYRDVMDQGRKWRLLGHLKQG